MNIITGKTPTIFAICVLSCVKDPAAATHVNWTSLMCVIYVRLVLYYIYVSNDNDDYNRRRRHRCWRYIKHALR